MKFFTESVKKNCLAVAALPPTLKNTPVTPFLVKNKLSVIEDATTSFLLVRVKASFTSLSNWLVPSESLYFPSPIGIL